MVWNVGLPLSAFTDSGETGELVDWGLSCSRQSLYIYMLWHQCAFLSNQDDNEIKLKQLFKCDLRWIGFGSPDFTNVNVCFKQFMGSDTVYAIYSEVQQVVYLHFTLYSEALIIAHFCFLINHNTSIKVSSLLGIHLQILQNPL